MPIDKRYLAKMVALDGNRRLRPSTAVISNRNNAVALDDEVERLVIVVALLEYLFLWHFEHGVHAPYQFLDEFAVSMDRLRFSLRYILRNLKIGVNSAVAATLLLCDHTLKELTETLKKGCGSLLRRELRSMNAIQHRIVFQLRLKQSVLKCEYQALFLHLIKQQIQIILQLPMWLRLPKIAVDLGD